MCACVCVRVCVCVAGERGGPPPACARVCGGGAVHGHKGGGGRRVLTGWQALARTEREGKAHLPALAVEEGEQRGQQHVSSVAPPRKRRQAAQVRQQRQLGLGVWPHLRRQPAGGSSQLTAASDVALVQQAPALGRPTHPLTPPNPPPPHPTPTQPTHTPHDSLENRVERRFKGAEWVCGCICVCVMGGWVGGDRRRQEVGRMG